MLMPRVGKRSVLLKTFQARNSTKGEDDKENLLARDGRRRRKGDTTAMALGRGLYEGLERECHTTA